MRSARKKLSGSCLYFSAEAGALDGCESRETHTAAKFHARSAGFPQKWQRDIAQDTHRHKADVLFLNDQKRIGRRSHNKESASGDREPN